MEYKSHLIEIDGHRISYNEYVGGKEIILAFHGFGQSKEAFEPLARELTDKSTIFSIDLFFHGNSTWAKKDHPLELTEWEKIIEFILSKHNIQKFSVSGFSMGGRFALATLILFSNRITRVYLIAPDGIFTSNWYKLATSFSSTRKLLRLSIIKPNLFNSFLNISQKLKLAPNKTLRFAENNMNNRAKRKQVYYSWVVFRKLIFPKQKIYEVLKSDNKSIYLLAGKYDTVIP
ncbi:MAG: alpha/beta hydrolase, partial [Cytophagales bacterium]